MAVSDYSTTPANNAAISGINVAEGWAAGNANNAFRQLMADIKVMYDGLPDLSSYVTKTGGVFATNPTYTGRGGYHYNNDVAATGGRWFTQPQGDPVPAGMVNGDFLAEY